VKLVFRKIFVCKIYQKWGEESSRVDGSGLVGPDSISEILPLTNNLENILILFKVNK
jgi:hypothetical protein